MRLHKRGLNIALGMRSLSVFCCLAAAGLLVSVSQMFAGIDYLGPECGREIVRDYYPHYVSCTYPDCSGMLIIRCDVGRCIGRCEEEGAICLSDHSGTTEVGWAWPCIMPGEDEPEECVVNIKKRTPFVVDGRCYCGI